MPRVVGAVRDSLEDPLVADYGSLLALATAAVV